MKQNETNKRKEGQAPKGAPTVLTVGHSNRQIDEFIAILRAHDVETIADVRTVPRSRHNPQFNRDVLPRSLKKVGIKYIHLPALGGLRHTRKDSPNKGWRNASFRGYADYMQSEEFAEGMEELIQLAKTGRTALMCAEAVPWRCHRSLIADALLVRGFVAQHIMSRSKREPHKLTSFARVEGKTVKYPGTGERPEEEAMTSP